MTMDKQTPHPYGDPAEIADEFRVYQGFIVEHRHLLATPPSELDARLRQILDQANPAPDSGSSPLETLMTEVHARTEQRTSHHAQTPGQDIHPDNDAEPPHNDDACGQWTQDRGSIPTRPLPDADSEFEAFYKANRNSLLRFITALGSDANDANDIVQEVMTNIRRCWGRYELPDVLMYQLARRELRRGSQRMPRRAVPHDEHPDVADAARQPEMGVGPPDPVEERDGLRRLLARLSGRERELVVLVEVVGLGVEQVSAVLGIPPAVVRAQHTRTLARLTATDTERLARAKVARERRAAVAAKRRDQSEPAGQLRAGTIGLVNHASDDYNTGHTT